MPRNTEVFDGANNMKKAKLLLGLVDEERPLLTAHPFASVPCKFYGSMSITFMRAYVDMLA